MKSNKRMTDCGILLIVLQAFANAIQLLFTVWLTVEQIETGWGFTTHMEMMVLLPFMLELLCAPVVILGIAYGILCIFYKTKPSVRNANLILLGALILQYALTHLFIWF